MANLLTSKGLNDLMELKKKGMALPEGWQVDVAAYVETLARVKSACHIAYLQAQERHAKAIQLERFLNGR